MTIKEWNDVLSEAKKWAAEVSDKCSITVLHKGYESNFKRGISFDIFDIDGNYFDCFKTGTFNSANDLVASIVSRCSKFIVENS